MSDQERHDLADMMFNAIRSMDCHLVSATIHKPSHIARYSWPTNVRAYTLLVCLERFAHFLEDCDSDGHVI